MPNGRGKKSRWNPHPGPNPFFKEIHGKMKTKNFSHKRKFLAKAQKLIEKLPFKFKVVVVVVVVVVAVVVVVVVDALVDIM